MGPNTVAYLEEEVEEFMVSRPTFGDSVDAKGQQEDSGS